MGDGRTPSRRVARLADRSGGNSYSGPDRRRDRPERSPAIGTRLAPTSRHPTSRHPTTAEQQTTRVTQDGVGSDGRPDLLPYARADPGRHRIPSPPDRDEPTFGTDGAQDAEGGEPVDARRIAEAAHRVDGRSDRASALAVEIGGWLPAPGSGRIADRWRAPAALGVGDLTAARVVEAHTDALAILAEAESDAAGDRSLANLFAHTADRSSTWGVFAAEGPGVRGRLPPGGWLLAVDGDQAVVLTGGSVEPRAGDGAHRQRDPSSVRCRSPAPRGEGAGGRLGRP